MGRGCGWALHALTEHAQHDSTVAVSMKTKRCDRRSLVKAFLCCSVFLVILLAFNGEIFSETTCFQFCFNHQRTAHQKTAHQKKVKEGGHINGGRGHPYDDHAGLRSNGEFGYILVSRFSDQMTGASLNLLSLQCWASTIGHKLRVVEPFLLPGGSKFGISLTANKRQDTPDTADDNAKNSVRLRDMLDIESWERETSRKCFSPLISWKLFLKLAPPNIIAVRRECVNDTNLKCKYSERRFNSSVLEFSKLHRFKIVRYVYLKQQTYTSIDFRNLIYGDHNVSNTVVLFSTWGGIYNAPEPKSFRMGIPEVKSCHRHSFVSFPFRHSQQIRQDSERYLEKYLPGSEKRGYISVMFRSERFALSHGFQSITSTERKRFLLVNCVKGISTHVNNLKRQFGIERVFLAMDCRKQGSKVFRRQTGPGLMNKDLFDKVASTLFQSLFGNYSSLKEWDKSFDEISTFKSAGYLAQLQKYLAAHATCLLTAGGGGFQQSAVKLYNESHWQSPSHKSCAMEIPQCY